MDDTNPDNTTVYCADDNCVYFIALEIQSIARSGSINKQLIRSNVMLFIINLLQHNSSRIDCLASHFILE